MEEVMTLDELLEAYDQMVKNKEFKMRLAGADVPEETGRKEGEQLTLKERLQRRKQQSNGEFSRGVAYETIGG